MIWKREPELETLRQLAKNTLLENLGIILEEVGPDFLSARMPVDHRTVQPFRILHGGASVALAESLGSFASTLTLEDLDKQTAVGVEINASHLRSVPEGSTVTGRASPVSLGRSIQVWQIDITDDKGRLVCVSRLTMAVVERRT